MKVYEIVTNKIIECLNQGVAVWQKDWKSMLYSNYCTKKEYQGINQLLLFGQSFLYKKNFKSPFYLTWNQIINLNGTVIKGEKASFIILYKHKIIQEEIINENNEKKIIEKKISFIRYYNVFNFEQTTGIPEINVNNNEIKTSCEDVINNMKEKPEIISGANPLYNSKADLITIPPINHFNSSDSYYSTLFHELIHWTGHPTRLNRFSPGSIDFKSESYSKEELVAELGSSYLCQITGIEKETLNNQASYIKGWLAVLNNDKRLILNASSLAQRAVDYVLGVVKDNIEKEYSHTWNQTSR